MLSLITGLMPSDGLTVVTELYPVSQRRITVTAANIAASADVNVSAAEPNIQLTAGGGGVTFDSTSASVNLVS